MQLCKKTQHKIWLSIFLVFYLPLARGGASMEAFPNITAAIMNSSCTTLLEAKNPPTYSQGLCMGIIYGVEDNATYDKKICIPKAVDQPGRLTVVREYLLRNLSRSKEAYASLVFDALYEKWPCKLK